MSAFRFQLSYRKDPVQWPKIGVIGGGVIGISSALAISQAYPKCQIIIYTDKLTPDTTGYHIIICYCS